MSRDHAVEYACDIFGEVFCAVAHTNNNRALCPDGLPAKFFEAFYDVLGKDLYDVLLMLIIHLHVNSNTRYYTITNVNTNETTIHNTTVTFSDKRGS